MSSQAKSYSVSNSPFQIQRGPSRLIVANDLVRYEWTLAAAGFPAAICFADTRDSVANLTLRASVRGRGIVRPHLSNFAPEIVKSGDALVVTFPRIDWTDARGAQLPGYRLSLQYELHPDGAAFVTTFFYTETLTPGAIRDFILEPVFSLPPGHDVNWANWRLPEKMTGKLIQDLTHFERRLTRQDERKFDRTILPFVSFDYGADGRRDRHVEFFVESRNALTQDPLNTATAVEWDGRQARVSWNFERAARPTKVRAYQWRNVWGWCLRQWPTLRRPPLRIYHYLDNFERYPDSHLIGAIAAQGANVLILHENWRLDMKNGEMAYDPTELRRTVNQCHRHGLRFGLYVRGNEDAIREGFAEALRPYLKQNWDGIYMDYGTPITFLGQEENAPGGRIHFREYYRMSKRIREFVGERGFYISHSGSFFSAIGHTFEDAYLGGEQEKGALLNNPTVHAYFSGLAVAPSSLWTAAFPTYRTRRVLPFLAASLQVPFLHAGTQGMYSSLSHPKVPSTITFARPLWRLWALFDDGRPIRAYSTQSTAGVFRTDSASTGASLMVNARGEALLIVANYADRPRAARVRVNWTKLGLKPGGRAVALVSETGKGAWQTISRGETLSAELEDYGVGGWLITQDPARWSKRLAAFARPYPADPAMERKRHAQLDAIKTKRFQPPAWPECYLRVSIPNYPSTYEDSIWFDIFENTVELQDLSRKGNPRRLGYVSRRGLVDESPRKADLLWPGVLTPWIPLHRLPSREALGKRVQHLGLATRRGSNEFYSFVKAELSPRPELCRETYDVLYDNDIDLDWSLLTFDIRLTPERK